MKNTHHITWKMDSDYRKTLSAEDKAWLDQFNKEYYLAQFPRNPLHPMDVAVEYEHRGGIKVGSYKQERYAANNASVRDVATKHCVAIVNEQSNAGRGSYTAADWQQGSVSYENILIEVLDKAR